MAELFLNLFNFKFPNQLKIVKKFTIFLISFVEKIKKFQKLPKQLKNLKFFV